MSSSMVSQFNFANTMGTVPPVATKTLSITQDVFSSFVTPQIVVPFPSQYARQTQLAYTFTNAPVYTRTPNTYGGVEATSGYQSMLAEAAATGGSSGSGSGNGGGGGFKWPTWATGVVAGVGALILITLITALCCWRKRSNRRKRERHQQRHRNGRLGAAAAVPGARAAESRSRSRSDKAGLTIVDAEKRAAAKHQRLSKHVDDHERLPSSRTSPKISSRTEAGFDTPNSRTTLVASDYDYPHADYPMPPPPIDARGLPSQGSPRRHLQGGYSVHPDSDSTRSLDPAAYGPLPLHNGIDWSGHRRNMSGTSDDTGYITPDDRTSRRSVDGSPAGLLANAAPIPRASSHGRQGTRRNRDYGEVPLMSTSEWDRSPQRPHSYPAALQSGRGNGAPTSESGHAALGSAMLLGGDNSDESPNQLSVQKSRSSGSRSPGTASGGSDSLGPPPTSERSSFETSRSAQSNTSLSRAVESRRSREIRRSRSPADMQ